MVMTMSERDGGHIMNWESKKRDMVANSLWLIVTALALVAVTMVWPFQSWEWGLLLGAGVGGSAMMVVGHIVMRSGLSQWFQEGYNVE